MTRWKHDNGHGKGQVAVQGVTLDTSSVHSGVEVRQIFTLQEAMVFLQTLYNNRAVLMHALRSDWTRMCPCCCELEQTSAGANLEEASHDNTETATGETPAGINPGLNVG